MGRFGGEATNGALPGALGDVHFLHRETLLFINLLGLVSTGYTEFGDGDSKCGTIRFL